MTELDGLKIYSTGLGIVAEFCEAIINIRLA
jgi:hypothetical protein